MNESARKLKSDSELLGSSKYVKEVRKYIEFLGFEPDTIIKEDTDENIEIIMNAKSIVDKVYNANIFEKDISGKYTVLAKISAIAVMTGSLGIKPMMNKPSDVEPYYAAVSEWTDIPEKTLRRWWVDQDFIKNQMATLGYASVMRTAYMNVLINEEISKAIYEHTDWKEMVKTPQGLMAAVKVQTGQMLMTTKMIDQGVNLKNLVDDGKGDQIVKRNIGLVEPEPIIIKKGETNGSSTDKG